MKQWYAVHCRPRQEERAEQHLARQGYEIFRPRMRAMKQRQQGLRPVIESLFPRYLFIQLDNCADNWAPIRSTRGVVGLVRSGDYALPVPGSVIEAIKSRIDPVTGCADLTAETDYHAGDRLAVTGGPFRGCQAIFQCREGEGRVVVLLQIMQKAHSVILSECQVSRR